MFTRAVAKTCLPLLALVNSQPQDEAGMRSAQSRILARLVHRLARLPVGRHFGLEKLPTDHRLPAAFDQMMQVTTYGDYSGLIARVAWRRRWPRPAAPPAQARPENATSHRMPTCSATMPGGARSPWYACWSRPAAGCSTARC